MAVAEYRLIQNCLSDMIERYMSRRHSIKFIHKLLINGTLPAKGSPFKDCPVGWKFLSGGETQMIPRDFWMAVGDIDDKFNDAYWGRSAFAAAYDDTIIKKFSLRQSELVHAYVKVQLDWRKLEELLKSEDLIPPMFLNEASWLSEDTLDLDSHELGRNRGIAWDEWIAALAAKADRKEIRQGPASQLIRAVKTKLAAEGIEAPANRTVQGAAEAVLRRLYPHAGN